MDSIRLAVLILSSNKQYRGIFNSPSTYLSKDYHYSHFLFRTLLSVLKHTGMYSYTEFQFVKWPVTNKKLLNGI